MPEIRWILLVLGLLLLVGIWWWGSRRSAQAPGNAELRESTSTSYKDPEFVPEPRERSTPGFEPVSIHPAEFDRIPVMHEPIMVDIEPSEARGPRFEPEASTPPILKPVPPVRSNVPEPSADPARIDPVGGETVGEETGDEAQSALQPGPATRAAAGPGEGTDRFQTAPPQSPNTAEKQKIVSIRVCATGTGRWQGNALLAAFELNGLAYGKYQVFHRRHVDGRSLFCVASMTEPGVFDVAKMQGQEFRGVTLFAVLPGPMESMLTVDELLLAARDLAIALNGAVQDAKGAPMTAQRAAALRDEVARFQASLPVT